MASTLGPAEVLTTHLTDRAVLGSGTLARMALWMSLATLATNAKAWAMKAPYAGGGTGGTLSTSTPSPGWSWTL